MRVEAIYISPVKSLALLAAQRVTLGKHGIVEDRRFFLVNDRARLVTQREVAPLTQVRAEYTIEPEVLRLRFPDGRTVEGTPVSGEPITARFFGERDVEGFVVGGDWGAALSEFAGMRLRLVRAATSAFDGFPVSILSTASVEALRASSGERGLDERRFRPNFYISGPAAHGEDAWIGGDVRIGATAVVRSPDGGPALRYDDTQPRHRSARHEDADPDLGLPHQPAEGDELRRVR